MRATTTRQRPVGGRTATAITVLVALVATLGVLVVPAPAGAATTSVTNATSMAIPAAGIGAPAGSPASPYPSTVQVSDAPGTVSRVTVRLNQLSHAVPRDIDMLLVGPQGQRVLFLSDAGGINPVSGVSPTFADDAAGPIPSGMGSGTYQPTNLDDGSTDQFPSPAPAGPYASALSAFNGTNPNGTWSLYVVDDAAGDIGTMAGGWTLTVESGDDAQPGALQLSSAQYVGVEGDDPVQIRVDRVGGTDGVVSATLATGGGTATPVDDYVPFTTTVTFADGQSTATVPLTIVDDDDVEGIDETVDVTLSAPTGGATLGSPTTATVRIVDDDIRANATPITIPGTGTGSTSGAPASPYPSIVVVRGATGVVSDVTVTVTGLSHSYAPDIDMLLVAPDGTSTLLLSDAGGQAGPSNAAVVDATVTFDDQAATGVPSPITSGTYRPTDIDDEGLPDDFPAPAPARPWGATLSALDGTSPNGHWRLFVVDDAGGDTGQITGGWSLDITTASADAGGPYQADEGSPVTLEASPDLAGATYTWDIDGDGTYGDATGINPTVDAATLAALGLGDGPTSSPVRVQVAWEGATIVSEPTTLTIANVAPTATFGNDGPVPLGEEATVTFTDQGDPSAADVAAGFRYAYDLDDDGTFEIGDGTYAGGTTNPSATVPASTLDAEGTFEVRGRIIDKDGGATDLTTTITVDPPPNAPPVADAGGDQLVNEGDEVTLDGTGSSDPDGDDLTFSWAQDSGPDVDLAGDDTATATFAAPEGPATLVFTLTVDDGLATDTDTVTVTVNQLPVADAGEDVVAVEGDEVALDGSGSIDPDGDPLTFSWVQTGGPDVELTGADAVEPTFTAPEAPATLVFTLTVADGRGGTDSDTVTVEVVARFTADEAWVDHVYRVLLGRQVDPAGLAHWSGRLDAGVARLAVARQVGRSPEALTGRVLDQRYGDWLERPVDAGARTYWGARLAAGSPLLELELSLLASPELFAQGGATDSGYVTLLYQRVLGRGPDAGGLAHHVERLDRGATRRAVADVILGSAEAERRRVAIAYQEVLGRSADPGGLDFWAAQLDRTRDLLVIETSLAAAWTP